MPKSLAEIKDNVLAWAMVFIVSGFAAGLAYQNTRIQALYDKNSNLSKEYVRLERYQADQARDRATLERIEANVYKLLMIAAKGKDGISDRNPG